MEVYYFTLFILMIGCFYECRLTGSKQAVHLQKLYLIPLLLIILQVGIRWEMATDWEAYFNIFKNSKVSLANALMEPGYLALNFVFYKISSSYQFFILVQSVFLYIVIFKLYKTITPYPLVALMWFYSINLGIVGSSRQLIALSIVTIGLLVYLKNKKWYFYIIFVFIAMQFHTSSFFAIVYIFFDRRISTKLILIILIFSMIVGLSGVSKSVFSYISYFGEVAQNKTEAYTSEDATFSYTAIFKRLVILFPLLYYRMKLKIKEMNIILNAYVFGICLYLVFGESFGILATRGAFYFNLMEPVIISLYLVLFRDAIKKHLYIIFAVSASVILLRQSITQYPEIFVPYKTQFFETSTINY